MESLEKEMDNRLKMVRVDKGVLTAGERRQLKDEIRKEREGYVIIDGILSNPLVFHRRMNKLKK